MPINKTRKSIIVTIINNIQKIMEDITKLPVDRDQLYAPSLKFRNSGKTFVMTSLGINLLSLALPIMTLQVYDRLLVNQSSGTLAVLIAGVSVAILLDMVLRMARAYVINWEGAVYEHTLTTNAIRHILGADFSIVNQYNVGKHLERISAISQTQEFHNGKILVTLIDLPFIVIFISLIAYLSGTLVFVPIILLTIFVFVIIKEGPILRRRIESLESADEDRLSFTVHTLENIHTVKGLGLEDSVQRQYESLQHKADEETLHMTLENSIINTYGTMFSRIMTTGIVSLGALLAVDNTITLGTLVACIILSGRIMQPVQRAMSVWGRYQKYLVSRKKIQEIFATPHSVRKDPDDLGHNNGDLTINNLIFKFADGDVPVLRNINLDLSLGDCISISGEHNSGRTTLVRNILGLYKPIEGEVLINGYSSVSYPARALIKQVGYLPSNGTIFRGTVRENITSFGEIPEEQAMEIARLLSLDKEISLLPNGYDTYLEDTMADALPPGVKQRIAIVRALAPKPRIILFDHADRSLDKEGYNQVYQLLAKLHGKATIILVTNDLNLLKLASKEYLLDQGELKTIDLSEGNKSSDVQSYKHLNI